MHIYLVAFMVGGFDIIVVSSFNIPYNPLPPIKTLPQKIL